MSTSAGSPGSPYRVRSSAADAYLGRHASRQQTHTCRCTLTVQAPPGKRLDPVALRASLARVEPPDGCRLSEEPQVYPGWQEEGV